MSHGMAVGADRPEIADWINHVGPILATNGLQVVDMDEVRECGTIRLAKIELAGVALRPVVVETGRACVGIAVISGCPTLPATALPVLIVQERSGDPSTNKVSLNK